jgi:hypothetical protein
MKPTLVHPYLSRAFQQYEMHGCGLGDLNVRNKTNKQPSLRDKLVWPILLAIIEFKIWIFIEFSITKITQIQYIPTS